MVGWREQQAIPPAHFSVERGHNPPFSYSSDVKDHTVTTCFRDKKKFASVLVSPMAFIEESDPIVFLLGNLTSPHLWRNAMSNLSGRGHPIASDVISTDGIDSLESHGPDRHSVTVHRKYLFKLLDQLGLEENLTSALQDWGSVLGVG
ncbi:hypothetical protein [Aestuariibius sp. HNIBRBA575]|uniref:hypothetical protein n=1 Tax=Aestuariibius sp. HNIBRBA575 TaxID=3233343 RepID=UPI0034A39C0D